MSTYVDLAINPKTGKPQRALFVDNFYGSHRYGVAFKNDGDDADLYDTVLPGTYSVYPKEDIKLPSETSDYSRG